MSDVLRAVEEIVDVLCKHLGPQVLNQDTASDIDIDRHDDFRSDMQEVAADILAIPTLRAALAPVTDDVVRELAAVKAERDRAQRACEQMGQRITLLEAALKPFSDKAHYWLERDDIHGLDDDDECATEIRFGDLRRARAALNQEPAKDNSHD